MGKLSFLRYQIAPTCTVYRPARGDKILSFIFFIRRPRAVRAWTFFKNGIRKIKWKFVFSILQMLFVTNSMINSIDWIEFTFFSLCLYMSRNLLQVLKCLIATGTSETTVFVCLVLLLNWLSTNLRKIIRLCANNCLEVF